MSPAQRRHGATPPGDPGDSAPLMEQPATRSATTLHDAGAPPDRPLVADRLWPLDHLPPFLTLAEAAMVMRTTEKAMRRLAERGRLPGLRRPKGWSRYLVATAELLSWLAEGAVSSTNRSR